jgi:hypothetical protein
MTSNELEGKDQSNKVCVENKCGGQVGLLSICPRPASPGPYICGQVSRNRSGPIHITNSVYDMNSYFDYDYTWAQLNGPQGYTSSGLYYLYPYQ